MDEAKSWQLPAILHSQAAPNLLAGILPFRGADLALDASEVRRLGGQCLQILLAARNAWQADGFHLLYTQISAELSASLTLFGLTDGLSTTSEG
jgi:chemotaxis protein CheX